MVQRFRNLAFGSRALGLTGIQFRSPKIFSIIHEQPCPGTTSVCQSMDTVINTLASLLETFARNPPANPVRRPPLLSS